MRIRISIGLILICLVFVALATGEDTPAALAAPTPRATGDGGSAHLLYLPTLGGSDAGPPAATPTAALASATATQQPTQQPTREPTVRISAAPVDGTTEGHAVFQFDSAVATECRLDDGAFAPCRSPLTLRALAPGAHRFVVQPLNRPGAAAGHDWTVVSVFAADHPHLAGGAPLPEPDTHGASFRIKCDFSHSNYDDPIVFPNQPSAAHLHLYFGNTGADAYSTLDSMVSTGESTCQGGALNRSAYWIPALLAPRHQDGAPVLDATGMPTYDVVLPTAGVNAPDIYYKAAVDDVASIQPMPDGLRMIAGDGRATAAQDASAVRWSCDSWTISSADDFSPSIPRCRVGDQVRLSIFFPSCWDGVTLYDPEQGHMAYPQAYPAGTGWTIRCPDSHGVALSQVSYNLAFPVLAEQAPFGDSRLWRLASDGYAVDGNVPGGYSAHGDWFMAWHPEIARTWTDFCLRAGRTCAGGDLGNGWRLVGMDAGTATVPKPAAPHLHP